MVRLRRIEWPGPIHRKNGRICVTRQIPNRVRTGLENRVVLSLGSVLLKEKHQVAIAGAFKLMTVTAATSVVAIVKHISIRGGNDFIVDHEIRNVVGVRKIIAAAGRAVQLHTRPDHQSFVVGELPPDFSAVGLDVVADLKGGRVDHVGKPIRINLLREVQVGDIGGALVQPRTGERSSGIGGGGFLRVRLVPPDAAHSLGRNRCCPSRFQYPQTAPLLG